MNLMSNNSKLFKWMYRTLTEFYVAFIYIERSAGVDKATKRW